MKNEDGSRQQERKEGGVKVREDDELRKKIVQKTIEAEKQIQRKRILYNTRILMEQYKEMRKHVEEAVSEVEELEGSEFAALKSEYTYLESVRRSKTKTALMIANIDKAMEELRKEYEEKGILYKWESFKMHYIDGMTNEDIADRLNCGKNTPSRWGKELIKKMSVKLFGVDGIERW